MRLEHASAVRQQTSRQIVSYLTINIAHGRALGSANEQVTGAPRARTADAGRLHRDGRADRSRRPAEPIRAGSLGCRLRGLAAPGHEMSVAVNLSARNLLDRDLPDDIARMLDRSRRSDQGAVAGDHRADDHVRSRASDREHRADVEPRHALVGRRLRDRLLLPGEPAAVADRRPQDRQVVRLPDAALGERPDHRASTINLGYDLGLRITAEGVEDAATLERLALLGCDLAQGFHIGTPMDATAFDVWLSHGAAGGRAAA